MSRSSRAIWRRITPVYERLPSHPSELHIHKGRKEFGDRGGAHVHFALSASPGGLDELVRRLEKAGVRVRGPVEHPGGDRSIYFADPDGNVVEGWDFLERPAGQRDGVASLA